MRYLNMKRMILLLGFKITSMYSTNMTLLYQPDREISAGSSCESGSWRSGNKVIIETNRKKTKDLAKAHHLPQRAGGVASNLDCIGTGPEHDSAITWLNAFLSRFLPSKTWNHQNRWLNPALLLTLIVGPWRNKSIYPKEESSERHHIRQLLDQPWISKVQSSYATISPHRQLISADAGNWDVF